LAHLTEGDATLFYHVGDDQTNTVQAYQQDPTEPVALLLSHWAALVATGLGAGLPLLTLQSADRPWETWLVLPAAWALVVWAARRPSGRQRAAVGDATPRIIAVRR